MSKYNTTCTKSCKCNSVLNSTSSYSGSSVITGTTYNRSSFRNTAELCSLFRNFTSYFRRFINFCQKGFINSKFRKNFVRPAAVWNILKLHSRSITYFCSEFACKHVADIVFWKKDVSTFCINFWFVITYPQNLTCCKAC